MKFLLPLVRRSVLPCFFTLFALFALSDARADSYLFKFDTVFTGTGPVATPPWASALFQDISPGTVRLTLSAQNLTGSENIDEIYINLNPSFDPLSLGFAVTGTSGGFDLPTINLGTDAFKADGDGRYDAKLVFATGGADANRFTAGEFVSYDLTGIPGLVASDFVFLSKPAGGKGPFYAAGHVQRIGPDGASSGWIAPSDSGIILVQVPEPAAGLLLVLGAGLLLQRALLFRRG